MIARLAIVAAGVLLVLVTVLLWKKLSAAWRAGMLAGAILVAGIGGAFTYGLWQQEQRDREYVYLSLRYLQNSDTDTASYYLKKVGTDTFQSLSAEALLETMRSNDVLARMKLDGANALAEDSSQEALAVKLGALGTDSQAWQEMAQSLLDAADLPEKEAQALNSRFVSESGYYLDGVDVVIQDDAGNHEENIRQLVSRNLGSSNFGGALQEAVSLVQENASAKNRLLLAESIAEATYSGYELSGSEFAADDTAGTPEEDPEREELSEQLEEISGQVADLDTLLQSETEEESIADLTRQKEELTTRQQSLQNDYDYIYIHRAFNSIADIHSLDAAIVRARLYFAMNDYARAVGRSAAGQHLAACAADAQYLAAQCTPGPECQLYRRGYAGSTVGGIPRGRPYGADFRRHGLRGHQRHAPDRGIHQLHHQRTAQLWPGSVCHRHRPDQLSRCGGFAVGPGHPCAKDCGRQPAHCPGYPPGCGLHRGSGWMRKMPSAT